MSRPEDGSHLGSGVPAEGCSRGPLLDQDRVVAALVALEQGFPGGYQVALGIRVQQAIEAVERLYAEHDLPARERLIAELTLWHCHVEEGLKFVQHANELIGMAIRNIRSQPPRRR